MTSHLAAMAYLAFDNLIKQLCCAGDLTRGIYGDSLGFECCHVSYQRKISLSHNFHHRKVRWEVSQMNIHLTNCSQCLHWQKSFLPSKGIVPLNPQRFPL